MYLFVFGKIENLEKEKVPQTLENTEFVALLSVPCVRGFEPPTPWSVVML